MQIGRYRFAPSWWAVLVLLGVAGALCSLGVWQIRRGEAKQVMLAQHQAASKNPPRAFAPRLARSGDTGSAPSAIYRKRYVVTGRVDADHQILFDDQVSDERIGYRVWTPVVLDNGTRVLVDRGWVPLGPGGRSAPPDPDAPTGRVHMTGTWRDLPRPGLRLGGEHACDQNRWPRVLNYPTIDQLLCQYDGPVADGLLLLDEKDPRGFVRDWNAQLTRMPPIRHFGYALQWFAMALAVAVIFLIVNLKRNRWPDKDD